jgi:hypothetical protein
VTSTGIVAGNHNDTYDLNPHLQSAFKAIKHLCLSIVGAFFNADSAFDTREAPKVCFNHHVIPNMAENKRNRKYAKRGPKRLFNPVIYKKRFPVNALLPGSISFGHCLSVLTSRTPISWHVISLPLLSLTCVTFSPEKSESVQGDQGQWWYRPLC